MTAAKDGPADTRMMGVVHAALERDLSRARSALTQAPYPDGRRRQAISAHVLWMMEFLHAHHSGEDAGLWPLVRARNPAVAPLLDEMDADHKRIAPAMEAVVEAARAYGCAEADEVRIALTAALDGLSAVLMPHLAREVEEMMPVVSASITRAEWQAWDQAHNIKPKSFRQLGVEGHWLLDGIDAQGYDLVIHQVPAVPRLILLHGFARQYRRQAAARWGAPATSPQTESGRSGADRAGSGRAGGDRGEARADGGQAAAAEPGSRRPR